MPAASKAAVFFAAPGAIGSYYNGYWGGNDNFFSENSSEFERIDVAIDFSDDGSFSDLGPTQLWQFQGTSLDANGLDNFSVKWTGQLYVDAAGDYDFRTWSDDGVQFYINNQLVIDNSSEHGATFDLASDYLGNNPISLTPGFYSFLMYYGENGGYSVAQLAWSNYETQSYSLIAASPVPAPLPVFGAAVAFRFSRRLRERVKASQFPTA